MSEIHFPVCSYSRLSQTSFVKTLAHSTFHSPPSSPGSSTLSKESGNRVSDCVYNYIFVTIPKLL